MQLHYKAISTPFKYPFTISGGRTKTHQPSLIIALQLGSFVGYGEAPEITYYNVTIEKMIETIEQKKKWIEKFAYTEPQRYWHYLHHLLPNDNFLVCALDMAAWDLYGKMKGKLLYELWNTTFEDTPKTNYTIGIDSIEKMLKKIIENPYPIYKIKVGFKDDIDLIKEIRKNTDAVIRLDANAGWQLDEAIEKIEILKKYDIELIEQPLGKDNWDDMKILYQKSKIPLFADESCVVENDVEKCYNHFHGINIKLTKCSGITPALRMIDKAKQLGLQIMMGSMNECSVGAAANANFLPMLNFVDMDGPLLLNNDNATGLKYDNGKVTITGKAGLGISLK